MSQSVASTSSSNAPCLYILVGGNGSGKSTYYDLHLRAVVPVFVNADLIAKEQFGDDAEAKSLEAAKIAEDTRYRLVDERVSFCFETVFSHPSKIDFLAHAKSQGYSIRMVAIYTDNPQLNVARVAQRVQSGGHDVPEQKIIERIARTYAHVGDAVALCDQFVLLDNSSATEPFKLKMAKRDGLWILVDNDLPDFAASFRH